MERKLLILSGRPAAEFFPDVHPFQVTVLEDADREARLREIEDAEVVFGEPSAEELAHAKKLRWVQLTWAGAEQYGNFPGNVRLTTASGAFGETIAEHVLAMLLALCRRLPAYARSNTWRDLGTEKALAGTAMIFGAGDIGSHIARLLQPFDVRIIGVCRNPAQPRTYFDSLISLCEAERFLPAADFVLCALPGGAETDDYFSRKRLSLLRRDAILVNVGRGRLIDTEALCAMLQADMLFGAGLDVINPEPLPAEHPLWRLPNVILTPHVAGVSFGHLPKTSAKIWKICFENLRRYLADEPLRNQVRP